MSSSYLAAIAVLGAEVQALERYTRPRLQAFVEDVLPYLQRERDLLAAMIALAEAHLAAQQTITEADQAHAGGDTPASGSR